MGALLSRAVRYRVPLLAAAVLLPRLLWFAWLGGGLPRPHRDQGIYLRMAGRIAEGHGLSFSAEAAWVKHVTSGDSPLAEAWSGDPGYMFGIAPVETPTAAIEPGYPLLLGGLFALLGPVSGAVFLLNCAAALLGAWAVWRMVRDAWGEGPGVLAALLWALYPYYVYYSAYAMSETLHFALLPLVAWTTMRAGWEGRSGACAGASSGLLFLVRSTAVFLLPLQGAVLLLRRRYRALPALLGAFALCVLPWVARNQIALGSPVLLPTKGSLNLWMRNRPEILALEGVGVPEWAGSDGSGAGYPSMAGAETELERSALLGEAAVEYVSANLPLYAWLSLGRLVRFVSPLGGTQSGALSTLAGLLVYLPMMALGTIAVVRMRRDGRLMMLVSVFLLYAAVHAMAHGGVRYRLPVDMVPMTATALWLAGPGRRERRDARVR